MNKKYIYISAFFLMGLTGLSSCKDNMEEITTLQVDRAFSPTGLTAAVVNKIGVTLTWKAVNNATSYTIEFFENTDFSGTPVKTISDITFKQVPYTVPALGGDTQYAVRVKAVGEGVADSKWVTALFKTDGEQIFNPILPANITSKSVILTWPAGEVATSIVLTPGNITHAITPAEIAAGKATVDGLIAETNYTAKLMNGTKTRGTVTFLSAVDIGNAILINNAAELKTAVTNAAGGETFALAAGNYVLETGGTPTTLVVNKSISIVAVKAVDRPVLTGVSFNVQNGASFKIKNLILEGGTTPANYTVAYTGGGNYGDLEIEGSIVRNYGAGVLGLTSTSVISTISSVLINNNIFNTFAANGEFIDFRASFPNKLTFTNNTLSGTGDREFMRIDANSGASYPAGKVQINVSNNTLYALGGSVIRRLFYVRIPAASHEITFTKNIVTNTAILLANQAATNLVTLSGNNYFTTTNLISSTATGAKVDASGTALDPGFTAAATGNFKLSNQTLISNGIGDPRWK